MGGNLFNRKIFVININDFAIYSNVHIIKFRQTCLNVNIFADVGEDSLLEVKTDVNFYNNGTSIKQLWAKFNNNKTF